MLSLKWRTCGDDGHWCSLTKLNLSSVKGAGGVYIIWHTGQPSRVVRVGQGAIANRLAAHREDPDILAYRKFGELRVTWAAVPANQRDGVEAYLADKWSPLAGDRYPHALPIAVSSPWG
jgi:hypothetical protein